MFKKLQNKVAQQVTNREAFKFQFNLSIDYLSDLKEKKKDECTYAISWKRGKKRKGETDFHKAEGSRVVWNTSFKFNGTLYFKKGKFQKKDLQITLEEKGKNNKTTTIAKETLDLALLVDEDSEQTNTKDVELVTKDSKAKLKLVINSKCLKDQNPNDDDFTAVSTYTGPGEEAADDEGTNNDVDKDEDIEEHDYNDHHFDEEDDHNKHEDIEEEYNLGDEKDEHDEEPVADVDEELQKIEEEIGGVEEEEEPEENHSDTNHTEERTDESAHANTSEVTNQEIAELEKQLSNQKKKMKLLLRQIKELKANDKTNLLKKTQRERDSLLEKLKSMQKENEELKVQRDKAQEAQQEVDGKLFELSLKQKQSQKNEAEIKKLKDRIKQLEEENESGRSSSSKQKQAISFEYDEKIQNLEDEISTLREKAREYQESVTEDKKQIEKLKKDNDRMQEELKAQKVNYESELTSHDTRYQKEIDNLKQELLKEKEERKTETNSLKQDAARLKEERKNLAELVTQQGKEITLASKQRELLLSCLTEFKSLKSKVQNTLVNTASSLGNNEEIASVLMHSDSFSEILEMMKNGTEESIQKAKLQLENEVKEEISAISDVLVMKLAQLENQSSIVREQNDSLQESLRISKQEKDDKLKEIATLQESLKEITNQQNELLQSLTNERQLYKEELDSYMKKLATKEEEITQMQSEKKHLLSSTQDEINKLKESLLAMEKERNALKIESENLGTEMTSLQQNKELLEHTLNQQIVNLKNQLDEAKKQQSSNESEAILDLTSKLSDSREKLQLTEKQNIENIFKVESQEKTISSLQTRISSLTTELEEIQNKYDQIAKSEQQKDTSIRDLEQQLSNLNQKYQEQEDLRVKAEDSLKEELNSLRDMTTKLNSVHDSNSASKTSERQHAKISPLELSNEAQKLKNVEIDLNKLIETLRQERMNLDGQITELKSNNEMLQSKLNEKEHLLNEKSEEIAQLSKNSASMDDLVKKQKVNLEKKLADTENQLKEHEKQISALNQSLEEKNEEVSTLEKELETAKEENKSHLLEVKKLEKHIQILQDDNAEKDSRIEQIENDLSEMEEKLYKAEKSCSELEEELATKEKEIKSLKKNSDKTKNDEDKIREKERVIEELEEKLQEFEQQKIELSQIKQERKELETDIEKWKEENDELNQKIEYLDERNSELESKLKKSKTTIVELEEEVEELKSQSSKFNKQLEESQKSKSVNDQDVKKIKEQLSNLQTQECERFLVESAIIHSQAGDFLGSSKVPCPAKILFLSALRFSPETHKYFCTNVIKALSYIVHRYARDEEMMIYWVNCMYRILNLIQNSGNESQVHHSLENMEPVNVNAVLSSQNTETAVYVEPPTFSSNEGDEVLVSDIQEFTDAICEQLSIAYLNLCTRIVQQLKERLLKAVFNPKQASSKSTDGGPDMRICCSILNDVYQRFEQQKLDKRVTNHLFENLACCLDSLIFNQFVRDNTSASKGLQVKMSVTFLENWFTSKGIVQTLRKNFADDEELEEEKLQVYFTLSRQAADICVIAQTVLLQDEDTRRMVCPELTVQQIAFIYSVYKADEYSTSSFSQRDIEEIIGKRIPHIDAVLSVPVIDFQTYTDISSKSPHHGNVFMFDLVDGHGKLNSLEIPKRFFPTKFADQLGFLK
ncbi:hypothetical protein C9374_000283 [Naegleria lovaniensis]|uniref:C2 NT-type domain-containing protein n=1 Tax=Naegleria lovaniensis TaxID=51637 RepID=A0AA88GZH9_NAELO|nr:uncharacterized protein C9374_000283 [Naegleria lovaniensis]KAG2388844.1 hypothetical protein C9374_000283 [Naegleria lovaniensis]